MEKRFLLAVILSFLTLYLWQAVTPKPVKNTSNIEKTQTISGQQDILKPLPFDEQETSMDNESDSLPLQVDFKNKKISLIEGDTLDLGTSNIGGTLDSVFIKKYEEMLPLNKIGSVFGLENVEFVLTEKTDRSVSYTYEDENYLVTKNFVLGKEDYSVQVDISIVGKTKMSNLSELAIGIYTADMSSLDNGVSKHGGDSSRSTDKSLKVWDLLTASLIDWISF